MKNITPDIRKQKSLAKETLKTIKVIGALLLLVGAILWPLATIWSLNILFGLSIEYTFLNWLACVILIITLQGALRISRTTISSTNN